MANRRNTADETAGPRSHEDTWGASEPAKAKWAGTNADKVRKEVARDNETKETGDA